MMVLPEDDYVTDRIEVVPVSDDPMPPPVAVTMLGSRQIVTHWDSWTMDNEDTIPDLPRVRVRARRMPVPVYGEDVRPEPEPLSWTVDNEDTIPGLPRMDASVIEKETRRPIFSNRPVTVTLLGERRLKDIRQDDVDSLDVEITSFRLKPVEIIMHQEMNRTLPASPGLGRPEGRVARWKSRPLTAARRRALAVAAALSVFVGFVATGQTASADPSAVTGGEVVGSSFPIGLIIAIAVVVVGLIVGGIILLRRRGQAKAEEPVDDSLVGVAGELEAGSTPELEGAEAEAEDESHIVDAEIVDDTVEPEAPETPVEE